MPFNQSPQQIYPGGQAAQSPLDTLQQLMSMKMQYDQTEKTRQQQVKEQLQQIQTQHDLQKQLMTFKADLEGRQKKQQLEEQIKRSMEAIQGTGGLREQYTDQNFTGSLQQGQQMPLTPEGQDIVPPAMMYAQTGQDIPASLFTKQPTSLDWEKLFVNQAIAQGRNETQRGIAQGRDETQREIAQGRNETQMGIAQGRDITQRGIAQGRNETQMGIAKLNYRAAMARIRNSKEISDSINGVKLSLAGMKSTEDAWTDANNAIEKTAKALAGPQTEVTGQHRAEAIRTLASIHPEVFGKYLDSLEQEKPGFLNMITGGWFGKPQATINTGTGQAPAPPAIKPLGSYDWNK